MPFLKSQGENIYYEKWGEKGVPIVFLHPPAMGGTTFVKQKALADEFQVIVMDARGHGFSSGKGTLTISEWAIDVNHLLEKLQLEKAVICGYSSGGSAALEFAIRWPEKTKGVVLTGGFPEVCTTLLQKQFELGIQLAHHQYIGLLAHMLSFSHATDYRHRRFIYDTVLQVEPLLLKSLYESGLSYKATNRLSQFASPLLLIYGRRDWYVHYYPYLFYKHRKGLPTDVVFVDKVAHQVPTRASHVYNAVICRFARHLFSQQSQSI